MSSKYHSWALKVPCQLDELEMQKSLYTFSFSFLRHVPTDAQPMTDWCDNTKVRVLCWENSLLYSRTPLWIMLGLRLVLKFPLYLEVPFPALLPHSPTSQWFLLEAYV